MKMQPLILLRHGESEANVAGVFSSSRDDVGLSAAGLEQARRQALDLRRPAPAALYSSPLKRALQTAEAVRAATDVLIQVTDALREFDVGVLDGRDASGEAWEVYEAVRRQWEAGRKEAGFEEGESLADAEARLGDFLASLPPAPAGPIVLVGHGMIFMTLLWLFCVNRAPTLQGNYMERGRRTELVRDGSLWRIERFNLPPPGGAMDRI